MRSLTLPALLLLAPTLAACGGGGGGDGTAGSVTDFLHVTTSANTTGPKSLVDHPATNGQPDAVVLITHNLNPNGTPPGPRNDHPMSTGYDEAAGRWYVWNVDRDPLATGLSFNVTAVRGLSSAWRHVAESPNLVGPATVLDHPDLNGNAIALALVSKNPDSSGGARLVSTHEVGFDYDGDRWALRLQTSSAMSPGMAYNLYALPADASSFLFRAVPGSYGLDQAWFSHPDADGNPDAHVQISVRNDAGVTLNQPIGVWYDPVRARWAIFREDAGPMPGDATFVVRVR